MPSELEREIDNLYQLPLDEFTSARNALAKRAGADGAGIRTLQKPPIAAWAVNQLYWKRRDEFEALVEAAQTLAAAHKAVLSGKRADLRAASEDQEKALERALKATLALLQEAGQPATDSTRQAILTTLRALPADEAPGRLTRVLQPGGFEMLAGVPIKSSGASRATAPARAERRPAAREPAGKQEKTAADAKELARAKEAVATAARELRLAEHAARREEFEAARAARDAEKAARAVETARNELEAARRALEEAETEADAAVRNREAAEKRTRETEADVTRARARLAEAEKRAAGLSK